MRKVWPINSTRIKFMINDFGARMSQKDGYMWWKGINITPPLDAIWPLVNLLTKEGRIMFEKSTVTAHNVAKVDILFSGEFQHHFWHFNFFWNFFLQNFFFVIINFQYCGDHFCTQKCSKWCFFGHFMAIFKWHFSVNFHYFLLVLA